MRHLSIDFFRGMVVAAMIVVNSPGNPTEVYAPLRHAAWHGWTMADLIFPAFLFIIGVSMWFSFKKFERKWTAPAAQKILRRTLLLFAIGLLLNQFPYFWKNWDTWRIMGVPQRLALCYGVGAVLCLHFSRKGLLYLSLFLLILYQFLLFSFGIPDGDPLSLSHNAVLRLDLWLFGSQHLWQGEGVPFDPEGVLSTLPAIVTVLLGWLSGNLFEYRGEKLGLLVRDLIFYAIICMVLGLMWDLFFPINKKLWTSSFVLFSGGILMVVLAVCVWLIDGIGWQNGTGFFKAFGVNALFAYIFSEGVLLTLQALPVGQGLTAQQYIVQHFFGSWGAPNFNSLMFALALMLLCWAVCRILMWQRIFIKI